MNACIEPMKATMSLVCCGKKVEFTINYADTARQRKWWTCEIRSHTLSTHLPIFYRIYFHSAIDSCGFAEIIWKQATSNNTHLGDIFIIFSRRFFSRSIPCWMGEFFVNVKDIKMEKSLTACNCQCWHIEFLSVFSILCTLSIESRYRCMKSRLTSSTIMNCRWSCAMYAAWYSHACSCADKK